MNALSFGREAKLLQNKSEEQTVMKEVLSFFFTKVKVATPSINIKIYLQKEKYYTDSFQNNVLYMKPICDVLYCIIIIDALVCELI